METRAVLEALHIAGLVGLIVAFILNVVVFSSLNVVSLAAICFSTYFLITHNELFAELVEKFKQK
jgi:hypothetical protein